MATSKKSPYRRIILIALVLGAIFLANRYLNRDTTPPVDESPIDLDGTAPAAAAAVSGSWNYTLMAPEGAVDGTITITGSANNLRGMMSGVAESGSETLQNIVFSDPYLTFEVHSPDMDPIAFEATLQGDSFSGNMLVSGMDAVPINARRVPE